MIYQYEIFCRIVSTGLGFNNHIPDDFSVNHSGSHYDNCWKYFFIYHISHLPNPRHETIANPPGIFLVPRQFFPEGFVFEMCPDNE